MYKDIHNNKHTGEPTAEYKTPNWGFPVFVLNLGELGELDKISKDMCIVELNIHGNVETFIPTIHK